MEEVLTVDNLLRGLGMMPMPLLPMIIKLVLAVLCGGVLGIERASKRRAAGVRTYSMVALGAAVVMITGQLVAGALWDPARMAAQVVSGIGFIGAGAIIVTGYHEIKGLTTAAGLWASACMGLAVGAGYYAMALAACALLFCVVHFGGKLQDRMMSHIRRTRLFVMLEGADAMMAFLVLARDSRMTVGDIEQIGGLGSSQKTGVIFELKLPQGMSPQEAFDLLSASSGVLYIESI